MHIIVISTISGVGLVIMLLIIVRWLYVQNQRQKVLTICDPDRRQTSESEKRIMQVYSLRVMDLSQGQGRERALEFPMLIDTVCKNNHVQTLSGKVNPRDVAFLSLTRTRESLRLHQDLEAKNTRYLLMTGVVVRAWAISDRDVISRENKDVIVIGRLSTDSDAITSMPDGCRPVTLATPFSNGSLSRAQWNEFCGHLKNTQSIIVWAF